MEYVCKPYNKIRYGKVIIEASDVGLLLGCFALACCKRHKKKEAAIRLDSSIAVRC